MVLALKRTFSLLTYLAMALAASPSPLLSQKRNRVITWPTNTAATVMSEAGGAFAVTDLIAVEIVEFRVAGKPVIPDHPFTGGEDWLKDLTVRVKNVSGRPISAMRMVFAIPAAKYIEKDNREYGMTFPLEYMAGVSIGGGEKMKTVMPGEEVELVCFEQFYPSLRQEVVKKTGVTSIDTLRVGQLRVDFRDKAIWISQKLRESMRGDKSK